jgi:molecular chaperone DnaK
LLHKAEEAKVMLSFNEKAEIEFEVEDDKGEEHDVFLTITRHQFEQCIKPSIDSTIKMVRSILDKNNLSSTDIKHVLMVGGSTFIPYVRNSIKDQLGIEVNCSIDPTTAIAVGAAYYAGTKVKTVSFEPQALKQKTSNSDIKVRMAYQKTSHDAEEYFVAEFDGNWDGLLYRIIREDGGYDSGTKVASMRISEMLPLARNSFNCFTLKLFDSNSNLLDIDIPSIGILQGKFNIAGQPLPNDICIEVDDLENNTTRLEVIFEKNSILPIKKTITREISKTLQKGSDDSVIINIVEGDRFSSPSSNQPIGVIEIKAIDITRNLVKGSDVEITLEISESRDLMVTTYFLMTDQEFKNVFSPSDRQVNLNKLREDIYTLIMRAKQDLKMLQEQEKYEDAAELKKVFDQLEELHQSSRNLSHDDVTDARYQIEDKLRKISRLFDQVSGEAQIVQVKSDYFEAKKSCENWVTSKGSSEDKNEYQKIISREKEVLATDNKRAILILTEKLGNLRWKISQKEPFMIITIFHHFANLEERKYLNEEKAKQLIALGEKALERKNYDEVLSVVYQLNAILPPEQKDDFRIKGTGIG